MAVSRFLCAISSLVNEPAATIKVLLLPSASGLFRGTLITFVLFPFIAANFQ